MAKDTTRFVCQSCGAVYPRWLGRCTTCNAWNSLVEEAAPRASAGKGRPPAKAGAAKPIGEIPADDVVARHQTGIAELDRVLGGGAVMGSVTLLGGDPGVGKSTLLMQALSGLARKGKRCLYVSGEESAGQTAARAKRIGAPEDHLYVLAESDLGVTLDVMRELEPVAVVIDSVQTVRAPELESAAGTVSQLREVAARLVDKSKRDGVTTFLVGHVTKDGSLAGPKVLEHVVDTVLAFEGERGQAFRTLRAQKNRFGSATEVGVFEMTQGGMREVPNPSALFLAERPRGASGSVVCATSEGSRPMLVEVQALVSRTGGGAGRRTATGTDAARLAMILAVLERKCGLELAASDVFVNVAGGLRVDEPAVDLAVALAVASSARDRPLDPSLVAFGEIGLAGEVRSVARAEARAAEARAMGFTTLIAPDTTRTVAEALRRTDLIR
ncbi:MAG: DNA repair protein RadA [Myxococcales bacterium]|nr:DNA repair protein RadA [Myxococcales bacterium]